MKPVLSAAACLALAMLAAPVTAQMPTEAPGKPDTSRVTAGNYKLDPGHTQVTFTVTHLGFSLYRGQFGDLTGTMTLDPARPTAAKLSVDIPLAGIVTTSPALTEHLKKPEFFDAARFPTAHFESTAIRVDGSTAQIDGKLTIKGQTRPVTLQARFIGAGPSPMSKAETVGFEASASINRSDFGVSYGIPLVPDRVDLDISAAFEKVN